jgi:hypothetical protein
MLLPDDAGHTGELGRDRAQYALFVAMRVDNLHAVISEEPSQKPDDPDGAGPSLVHDGDVNAEPSEFTGQLSLIQQDRGDAYLGSFDQIRGHRRQVDLGAGPQVARRDVADPNGGAPGVCRPGFQIHRSSHERSLR